MSSIFMRFPGGKQKALTLSYDDGVEQDIKMVSILDKYGLKCTFNLNSGRFAEEGTKYKKGTVHRRMTEKQAVKLFKDSGHEVAVHALTHPFLEQLPQSLATYEVLKDRENLERLFGRVVRGMAYPFGTLNDDVVEALKASGIVYARTTVSTEKFTVPTDWLRLPATCHHNNPRLFELADLFLAGQRYDSPMLFYLWGHTYEFEQNDNWDVIEKFAEKTGGREDIFYATNIEVYNYIEAYKSMRVSLDQKIFENPTAYELFFVMDGKEYSIKPGETLYA